MQNGTAIPFWPSEDPWGRKGQAWGWAGALGKAAPATYLISGGMAWRMPASWRGDCPHEREVRNCSQRASEVAGWADKTLLSSMNRAAERGARDEAAGTQWPRGSRASGKRPWGGIADNMLLCADRESKARPQARTQEHRKPSRSFMPSRRSNHHQLPGLLGDSVTCQWRSRASAKPGVRTLRRQSVAPGCRRKGVGVRFGSRARSVTAKCPGEMVRGVRSASFA